jgi:hypothetical protein
MINSWLLLEKITHLSFGIQEMEHPFIRGQLSSQSLFLLGVTK